MVYFWFTCSLATSNSLVCRGLVTSNYSAPFPDGDSFYRSPFIRSVGNDKGENLRFCVTIKQYPTRFLSAELSGQKWWTYFVWMVNEQPPGCEFTIQTKYVHHFWPATKRSKIEVDIAIVTQLLFSLSQIIYSKPMGSIIIV